MMCNNDNQLILSTRCNPIRIRKISLIRKPPRITNAKFPRREHHDKEVHVMCSHKVNFVIQNRTVQTNKHAINECLETFHGQKHWQSETLEETTHYHERHECDNDRVCNSVALHKKMKNDDNIESFKIKSDDRFVLKSGKKDGRRLAKQLLLWARELIVTFLSWPIQ